MRKSQVMVSFAVAMGLLAGSAVGAAAQSGETAIMPVVEVTGASSLPDGCTMRSVPSDTETPDQARNRFTCQGSIPGSNWSMSDPRLEGTVLRIAESNEISGPLLAAFDAACAEEDDCDAPSVITQIRVLSIENAEGAWRERPRFVTTFPGSAFDHPFHDSWMTVLDGEGAYDGLVAVLQVTNSEASGQTYHGYVIDAAFLPPTPENARAE